MWVWLDESGHDRRHTIRKQASSFRGVPFADHPILARGVRYSAIPIMLLEGIHDVFVTEGTVDGDKFVQFITEYQFLCYINPRSVVIMNNASIHHVDEVTDLIERQCGAKLCFLPPYSPDLMPAEGVFSQMKSIRKENHKLFQVCTAPRALIAMAFGMVSLENCYGHISRCGYV